MIKIRVSTLLLSALTMSIVGGSALMAQQPATPPPSDARVPADTVGSALLYEFTADYDVVFKVIQDGLAAAGYEVNYSSKKRNLIETSFKQIANDENFFDEMSKYGDIPYIRSPGWTVGRVKMTVSLETLDSTRIAVRVLGLLSGFESRFSSLWHYWRSNGKLEDQAMNAIIRKMDDFNAKKAAQQSGQ